MSLRALYPCTIVSIVCLCLPLCAHAKNSEQMSLYKQANAAAASKQYAKVCTALNRLYASSNQFRSLDPTVLSRFQVVKPASALETDAVQFSGHKDYAKACAAGYISALAYLKTGDPAAAARVSGTATMAQTLASGATVTTAAAADAPIAGPEPESTAPAAATADAGCPPESVMHHDWRTVAPCVRSILAQARTLQASGNLPAAKTAYLHARDVNGIAGMYRDVASDGQITTGLAQIQSANPPPPPVSVAHAQAGGAIPTGRYRCYTGVSVTFLAGGIGNVAMNAPRFSGYLWIYDAHHYANMKEDDRGTYNLGKDGKWTDVTGPFQRVGTLAAYTVHGPYNKPTVVLSWPDAHVSLACQQ